MIQREHSKKNNTLTLLFFIMYLLLGEKYFVLGFGGNSQSFNFLDIFVNVTVQGYYVYIYICHPLLSSCEALSGILYPGLGPPVRERYGGVEAGTEKGHKVDQRAGPPLL